MSKNIQSGRHQRPGNVTLPPNVVSLTGVADAVFGRFRLLARRFSGEELVVSACKP